MSYRVVTDPAGAAWQVWTVRPSRRSPTSAFAIAAEYTLGWLAFERLDDPADLWARERRRLAPVPDDWERSSDADVLWLLSRATPVKVVRPRPRSP
jgi:hypothetical protein